MPEEQVPYEVKQERELVCPLRMIGGRNIGVPDPGSTSALPSVMCLKKKCAWWMLSTSLGGLYHASGCAISWMASER